MDDLTDAYIDMYAASNGEVTDGWGNYWDNVCPKCGQPMQVVRAGHAACTVCEFQLKGQGAAKEL